MSDLHFPDLSIKGFRGIRDISISQLGRVTLITGKNNTGKSSILEALRLHVRNATPYAIYNILAFREEYVSWTDEEESTYDPENVFHVSGLFHGYPELVDSFEPVVIATSGKVRPMYLIMGVEWFEEDHDSDGNLRLIPKQETLFGETDGTAALTVETEEVRQIHRFERILRYARLSRPPRPTPSDRVRMPNVFVSPYGGEGTGVLGPLWDGVALTDNADYLVEALRIIDPQISAVSMVGGNVRSRERTAIVRADNIPRPVPLRSFGDGVNRLFAIILALVNASGGILLIDEFENSLHYSAQLDAWRMIFRLAKELDVQVFATSHSWDTIEAFQKATSEAPEEGALLRLNRRMNDIIPTVFVEKDLAIITRDKIEVR